MSETAMALPETADEFIKMYSFPDAENYYDSKSDIIELSYVYLMIRHYFIEDIPEVVEDYIKDHSFYDEHYVKTQVILTEYLDEMLSGYLNKIPAKTLKQDTQAADATLTFPDSVDEFITRHSYDVHNCGISVKVMFVPYVFSMIRHYFTKNIPAEVDDFIQKNSFIDDKDDLGYRNISVLNVYEMLNRYFFSEKYNEQSKNEDVQVKAITMPATAGEFLDMFCISDTDRIYGGVDIIQVSCVERMIKHYFSKNIPETIKEFIRANSVYDDHYTDQRIIKRSDVFNMISGALDKEANVEEAKEKTMPAAVDEFIDDRSFHFYDGDGVFDDDYVMHVCDVKEMVCHYFRSTKCAKQLSANDFVTAININIDNLIASMEEHKDPADPLIKVSLEFTKRFIEEFVKTAVVETVDTEKEFDITSADAKLSDTADMMRSEDYKERFKAEFYQLAIRYRSLMKLLNKWDNGEELGFNPTCPRSTYDLQARAMNDYLSILEIRARMEGIEL